MCFLHTFYMLFFPLFTPPSPLPLGGVWGPKGPKKGVFHPPQGDFGGVDSIWRAKRPNREKPPRGGFCTKFTHFVQKFYRIFTEIFHQNFIKICKFSPPSGVGLTRECDRHKKYFSRDEKNIFFASWDLSSPLSRRERREKSLRPRLQTCVCIARCAVCVSPCYCFTTLSTYFRAIAALLRRGCVFVLS